jgi:phospholipid/cholesterol/gamma-HCH transport system substrate-binding protein
LKLTREIKTAILVLTALLLSIWGYSFLKGQDLFSKYDNYFVVYDNVEGLSASAPVTLNGLVIGKVSGITINRQGKLVVEIQVKTDFPISKSSILEVYEPGFIGGKQIAIVPNLDDTILAQSGDTLQSAARVGLLSKVGGQLGPLQEKLESTLTSADSLLINLNKVLDDKNKENLSIALEQLTETMKHMNAASKTMNGMLAHNEQNINNTLSNLNKTSDNFAKLSDSLAKLNTGKMVKDIENTLNGVNAMISEMQSGKGTMGKLMKDEQLYNNLTQASKELELLLQDVRLNPTRYINVSLFGKKNKPYVAPQENE